MRGRCLGHALPPDVSVVGQGHVGENAIAGEGADGIGIGVHAGAGGHTEEAGLGVDGVQPAVFTEAHPGNVIPDGLDLPALDGRLEHREVGFAARGREGRGDVPHVVGR